MMKENEELVVQEITFTVCVCVCVCVCVESGQCACQRVCAVSVGMVVKNGSLGSVQAVSFESCLKYCVTNIFVSRKRTASLSGLCANS